MCLKKNTQTVWFHLVSKICLFHLFAELTAEYHLKGKDLEQPLTFLIGVRQYMGYHLHAIKQQLHSRMRKRVEIFERVMNMAKRDKEGPKNWKETHGGISQDERELKEEKKVEEVFVHKK